MNAIYMERDMKGIINNTSISNVSELDYYDGCHPHMRVLSKGDYIVDIFPDEADLGNNTSIVACLDHLLSQKPNAVINILIDNCNNPVLEAILSNYQIHHGRVCNQSLILSISKTKEPTCPKEEATELINLSKKTMQRMRTWYFKNITILNQARKQPLFGKVVDGMPTDSLGPFPEFILPTRPCKKTLEGYCTPCFFSKVEKNPGTKNEQIHSLIEQTKFIINNYDSVVEGFQCRNEDLVASRFDVTICYACNGSFFSNYETTREIRFEALSLLNEEFKKRKKTPLVYIESCVDDYKAFIESDEYYTLLPILKDLNANIIVGFESVDYFARDVLYLKDMNLEDFEAIVSFNNTHGLGTGAFLYRGFHSLTQAEIVSDTVISLYYLKKKRVMPVIMLPNLQEYTLSHLLYRYNMYNVIDPLTALTIVELTMWFNSENRTNGDKWLMGDLFGGPPAPKCSVFTNPRKIVCPSCAELIRQSLQDSRKSNSWSKLIDCRKKISQCKNECYLKYHKQIKYEEAIGSTHSRYNRARERIVFAKNSVENYLIEMENEQ